MTRSEFAPRALRALAIAIAIAGAFDPAITSPQSTRPDVAVIAVDPAHDSVLATRVTRSLSGSFTITPGPFAAAGATVLVGDRLPDATSELSAPVFAIIPDPAQPGITIEDVGVPAQVPLDARVPVEAHVRTTGARHRTLRVTLNLGDVVVDQAERSVATDDEAVAIPLAFTPTATGGIGLRITAALAGAPPAGPVVADAAVEARATRWSVLFYDPRPSWLATFVRRAVEGDDRFVVTSRVVTSRNISTDAGKPPGTLEDETALHGYDAIVVGAPDALSERDVAGLDRFLRRRGGSVLLLLDQSPSGPWRRLANAGVWLDQAGQVTNVGARPGDVALKSAEFAWPAHLPPGAEAMAFSLPTAGDTAARHPVIWRSPVGAGELIVSGALDVWRYRDPAISAFDPYWRTVIASAASAAPAPVTVTLSHAVAAPGEPITVTATVRDAMLRPLPVRTSVSATIDAGETGAKDGRPIALWPTGSVGQLTGTMRAPVSPGTFEVVVTADGNHADVPLTVAPDVHHATRDDREFLGAWVAAHGGRALPGSQLPQLSGVLQSAVPPTPRSERWHPLRSVWWLLPFAFALSGEWWWRRRRGLR